jgi:hypothetical protein
MPLRGLKYFLKLDQGDPSIKLPWAKKEEKNGHDLKCLPINRGAFFWFIIFDFC